MGDFLFGVLVVLAILLILGGCKGVSHFSGGYATLRSTNQLGPMNSYTTMQKSSPVQIDQLDSVQVHQLGPMPQNTTMQVLRGPMPSNTSTQTLGDSRYRLPNDVFARFRFNNPFRR